MTNTAPNRLVIRIIRILIVIIAVAGVSAALVSWGKGRATMLYLAGRTSTCTFAKALEAPREDAIQAEAFERVSKSSRLIRKEPETGLELWDTEQGKFWAISENEHRWLYLFLAEQATDIYRSEHSGVRPGDIVLDCGAHYGLFTRNALRSGASKVIAIEPAPLTLECLRRNLADEIAAGKVVVYPKGVWDKDDFLKLSLNHHESGANSFVVHREDDTPSNALPLTTIDKIVAELDLPRVDFIKMDIEGAERKALAGAAQTLKKFRPRMSICTYHLDDDPAVVPKVALAAQPDYKTECGVCTDWGTHIRQDVLHFY